MDRCQGVDRVDRCQANVGGARNRDEVRIGREGERRLLAGTSAVCSVTTATRRGTKRSCSREESLVPLPLRCKRCSKGNGFQRSAAALSRYHDAALDRQAESTGSIETSKGLSSFASTSSI